MSPKGETRRSDYVPRPASRAEQVVLAVCCLGLLAVFAALLLVSPDPRGFGTHEQLGLAPCSWPSLYGKPCPTCGVTTAASLLLHLRPVAAFAAQPFGALLAIAGLMFLVAGVRHLWRRESLFVRLAFWPWPWIALAAVAALLLSWWYRSAVF